MPGLPDELRRVFEPLLAVPALGGGRTRLRPSGNKAGVLHAGGVTVSVEPKVSLAQLMFLLDFRAGQVPWRDGRVEVAEHGDLAATVGDV